MIRRLLPAILFFAVLGSAPAADWKAELLSLLGPTPDYAKAANFLQDKLKTLEPGDKQTAEALLPFLARKLGDAPREQDLLCAYYDKYSDNDPDFGFLDDRNLRDFLQFWGGWKTAFPLVSDLNFLFYPGSLVSGLPASVEVGFDLSNPALYKLSLGPYTLEGGSWSKGFHILTLPVAGLFDKSGTYEFVLDLKAGGLVVRKPIRITVDVASLIRPAAPAPEVPPVRDTTRAAPRPQPETSLTGEIDLYVGDKLILKSRKVAVKPKPLDIPLGGPSMIGQKPYMPPPTTDPIANGVNILDALALTYKAIKDLFVKKPPKPSPPSYQKVASLAFTYVRNLQEESPSEYRATLTFEPSRLAILER